MKREIQNLPETAWKPYRTAEGIATDRQIVQTVHTMNGTKRAFRLTLFRCANQQPDRFEAGQYCYHAVASNGQESAPEAL